jgi:hypothetical protein
VKTKRVVLVEVETERLTIRQTSETVQMVCPFCAAEVLMASAERAALLCGHGLRWVVHQLETNGLHYIETNEGLLYICLNSLLKANAGGQVTDETRVTHEAELISGEAIKLLKE